MNMANTSLEKKNYTKNLQEEFNKLVQVYWKNEPYVKNLRKYDELEVRFGSDDRPNTKIDFDNIISKIKSLGFTSLNDEGEYMLRIQNEFINPTKGEVMLSNIRTEIRGLKGIQDYCISNDINKLLSSYTETNGITWTRKNKYFNKEENIRPIYFNDFNFRVGYSIEDNLNKTDGRISSTITNWNKSKKLFRYINRVTFIHPDFPVRVDMSIVKSNLQEEKKVYNKKGEVEYIKDYILAYTTNEANVFNNNINYEVELEVDNNQIGPGTIYDTHEKVLNILRKAIKYVLMGIQNSNYPIGYYEQRDVLNDYMKLLHGKDYKPRKIENYDFIGPSSYTLQVSNIAPINENATIPNIRKNYTVTDKADGERHLLHINNKGYIYLINNRMQVIFTGARCEDTELYNSLLDGELIYHDKYGKYINLYASFDIYFVNKEDVRALSFIPQTLEEIEVRHRLTILKELIKKIKPVSITKNSECPIKIDSKRFYPMYANESIFMGCNKILTDIDNSLYEYNTDGLIFTPASLGVGSNIVGEAGPLKKITWNHSFKWKPPQYNTIDFLCTTIKNPDNNQDKVSSIFQNGINTNSLTQISQYKTLELRCGYNEKDHGYLNPCQDIIDDKLPEKYKKQPNKKGYKPMRFYPTNPMDDNAGLTNILLRKDDAGNLQMFSEEGEVIQDNTIVEFRYEIKNDTMWNWIPLRVRYDKTAEIRQGILNFGNAYHVANSNWHSIHNPITEDMLKTGNNIPDELEDNNVYYNSKTKHTYTKAMRDFHNQYVKKLLITSVSKKGDTLIDYACGRAGDLPKWITSDLNFVFGIDVASDNLHNKIDGACVRYLQTYSKFNSIPYALFVHGNSSRNIRNGDALENEKARQITNAIFGIGTKDTEKLGKGVARQYGKGSDGFNISSCQFAIHYFFKEADTLFNFMRNISECTKLGGYFIGTCYDGQLIYNLLKKYEVGKGITQFKNNTKIWEIIKEYNKTEFNDDYTSIGYKINVFQESINKPFDEYLVNFDYLSSLMELYGFRLLTNSESKELGLPKSTGLFDELYNNMQNEIEMNNNVKYGYGAAPNMNKYEQQISFLNRYFVFKKITHVNAEKITHNTLKDISNNVKDNVEIEDEEKKSVGKPKKLNKKIVLETSSTN